MFQDFPGGSAGQESACNVGDLGLIPGLGRSLGKEMATHCSILTWRIAWTEDLVGYPVHGGLKELDMTERLTLFTFYSR